MAFNLRVKPCLCIRLDLGAILIAALEIIFNVVVACLTAATISHMAVIHSNGDVEHMRSLTYRITEDNPEIFSKTRASNPEPGPLFVYLYIIYSLTIVKAAADILCATLLILGIRQERLSFFRIWLVFKAGCITFGILLVVSNFILGRHIKTNSLTELSIAVLVIIGAYFFYVVYRLYEEIWIRQMNFHRTRPRNAHPIPAAHQQPQPLPQDPCEAA